MFRVVVALALGFGLVTQAGQPITEYTCRATGKRLLKCCCAGATRTDAPAFERAGCCDVSVTSFDTMAGLTPGSSDAGAGSIPAPGVGVVAPALVASSAAAFIEVWRRDGSRRARPHDTGPPIYLRARHLLI